MFDVYGVDKYQVELLLFDAAILYCRHCIRLSRTIVAQEEISVVRYYLYHTSIDSCY